jgi:hypothetical protein
MKELLEELDRLAAIGDGYEQVSDFIQWLSIEDERNLAMALGRRMMAQLREQRDAWRIAKMIQIQPKMEVSK